MKTLTIFFFAAVFAFVGQSCCPADNGTSIVSISSLTCETGIISRIDSSVIWGPVDTTFVTVNDSNDLSFKISCTDSSIRHIANSSYISDFGNTAMACDPDPTRRELQSPATEISIKTLHDLNDSVLSGMDVTKLFTFVYQEIFTNGRYNQSTNEASKFVREFNKHYNDSYYGYTTAFLLNLSQKEVDIDSIEIEVSLKFANGLQVVTRSNKVIIE